jgi:hypothetical protein
LALYGGHFVVKGIEAVAVGGAQASAAQVQAQAGETQDDDDAMTEKTSRTDDDILHDCYGYIRYST